MACENNKALKEKTLKEGDVFTCAEYFFDGIFNVVRIPKGSTLYHGSKMLISALNSFPLGSYFYELNPIASQVQKTNVRPAYTPKVGPGIGNVPNSVLANITETVNILQLMTDVVDVSGEGISPSWYGSLNAATLYSAGNSDWPEKNADGTLNTNRCQGKCVLAYKTIKDINIILLNDPLNMDVLGQDPILKNYLSKMFMIRTPERGETGDYRLNAWKEPYSADPLRKKLYSPLRRQSVREYDLPFAELVKKKYGKHYDGYGAPGMAAQQFGYPTFHDEVILFYPHLVMERDVENPNDYFTIVNTKNVVLKKYLEALQYYETTNVKFHAGNLYEHSLWCLLWAEYICDLVQGEWRLFSEGVSIKDPLQLKKIICSMAFLHDITKMNPEECVLNISRKKLIYYDLKEHPNWDSSSYPVFDGIGDDGKPINYKKVSTATLLDSLFPDENIAGNLVSLLKYVVRSHQRLGNEVIKNINFNTSRDEIKAMMYSFLDTLPGASFFDKVATVIASMADICATRPFGVYYLPGMEYDRDPYTGKTEDSVKFFRRLIENGRKITPRRSKYFDIPNATRLYIGADFAEKLMGQNKFLNVKSLSEEIKMESEQTKLAKVIIEITGEYIRDRS